MLEPLWVCIARCAGPRKLKKGVMLYFHRSVILPLALIHSLMAGWQHLQHLERLPAKGCNCWLLLTSPPTTTTVVTFPRLIFICRARNPDMHLIFVPSAVEQENHRVPITLFVNGQPTPSCTQRSKQQLLEYKSVLFTARFQFRCTISHLVGESSDLRRDARLLMVIARLRPSESRCYLGLTMCRCIFPSQCNLCGLWYILVCLCQPLIALEKNYVWFFLATSPGDDHPTLVNSKTCTKLVHKEKDI